MCRGSLGADRASAARRRTPTGSRRDAMGATDARIHIPAGSGRAVRVPGGGRFRITDLQGRQCCDLFAFNARDVKEYASAEHTRVYNGNLFPRVGQPFVTQVRRPILLFQEDHTPGKHDMLVAACNPSRYALLGVTGGHASCEDNLRAVCGRLDTRSRFRNPSIFSRISRSVPRASWTGNPPSRHPATMWSSAPRWTSSCARRAVLRTSSPSTISTSRISTTIL